MVSSIHFTLRVISCVTGRHLVEKKEKKRNEMKRKGYVFTKKKNIKKNQNQKKNQKQAPQKKEKRKDKRMKRERKKPCTRSPEQAGSEDVLNQRAPGVGGRWRGWGCQAGHGDPKLTNIAGQRAGERDGERAEREGAGATACFANQNPKT